MTRLLALLAVMAASTALFAAAKAADDYPSRPIVLVIPLPPGGTNDIMARAVSDKMSASLGQRIVIENRNAGGSGTVGTREVARAAPDGYTIILGYTSTLATGPHLYKDAGYDPRKDFAPIGLIATSALIVVVNPDLPVRSIPELIALAKAQPGKLSYASAGIGSGIHLGAVLFASMAGIELTHIPYKGSAPALTDLIGGHVGIFFSSLPPAIGLAKDGKIRALAVTGAARSKLFPELPTVAESGLPGYEAILHYGIIAPAGTPRPIVDKLNAALREAVAAEDTRMRLATDGTEPAASSPEEYAADIDREETKWSEIVRKSGAKVE